MAQQQKGTAKNTGQEGDRKGWSQRGGVKTEKGKTSEKN